MKKLFELGNRYTKNSDWKDFALVKLCLCAIGILIGICIPKKSKKSTAFCAACVFLSTYAILISKVLRILNEMKTEEMPSEKVGTKEYVSARPEERYTTIYEVKK